MFYVVENMWLFLLNVSGVTKEKNRYHVYKTARGFRGAQDGNSSGTEHVAFCIWLRSHAASLDSSSLPYPAAHMAPGGFLTSLALAPIFCIQPASRKI